MSHVPIILAAWSRVNSISCEPDLVWTRSRVNPISCEPDLVWTRSRVNPISCEPDLVWTRSRVNSWCSLFTVVAAARRTSALWCPQTAEHETDRRGDPERARPTLGQMLHTAGATTSLHTVLRWYGYFCLLFVIRGVLDSLLDSGSCRIDHLDSKIAIGHWELYWYITIKTRVVTSSSGFIRTIWHMHMVYII